VLCVVAAYRDAMRASLGRITLRVIVNSAHRMAGFALTHLHHCCPKLVKKRRASSPVGRTVP
jgi:hypothetical protein